MSRIWLGRQGYEELLSSMGRKLTEGDMEITREGRTASGKLVLDIIAIKKMFNLNYSMITGTVLAQLKALYETGGILNLKVERQDASVDEYQVKFRPFSRARYLTRGEWLWENITVELEEV